MLLLMSDMREQEMNRDERGHEITVLNCHYNNNVYKTFIFAS